jgi:hypothetical protein
MLPMKKKKREESAAAHWCFKVYSPYSTQRKICKLAHFKVYGPYSTSVKKILFDQLDPFLLKRACPIR